MVSAVGTALLTALTVLAVQLGFTKIQEVRGETGISITALSPKGEKVTLVKLQNPALGSPQYDLVNLNTTVQKRDPETPTYKIENASSVDKRIFSLAFIPTDANTKDKGILEIFLKGKRLFPITEPAAGMLKGINSLNIPIPENFGLQIPENEKLEVWLYNGTDATAVNVTFSVFIANLR